jgi:hypothetical protein
MQKIEIPYDHIVVHYQATGDAELDAIRHIMEALKQLDLRGQLSVLQYCQSRTERELYPPHPKGELIGPLNSAAGNTLGR